MIDQRVRTYIDVVAAGSFTQAAKKEYRSTVAVMKQITSLEISLGVKLLNRDHQGVTPTPAGKYLFTNAQELIQEAGQVVQTMKQIASQEERTIRVGTSLLRPSDELVRLWLKERKKQGRFILQLVPFVDQFDQLQDDLLTKEMDCVVTPSSVESWKEKYSYLPLGSYACQIGIPIRHPLAKKESLTWQDLDGNSIYLLAEGQSAVIDRLRSDIATNHPQVHILDLQHLYDINSFNQAIAANALIELPTSWKDINPEIKTVPMDWEYQIPYGVLYRKNASTRVKQFIELLANIKQNSW